MIDSSPDKVSSDSAQLLVQAFAKLDQIALGVAVGILSGLAVFAVTIFLIIKGGNHIGPNLALLGQYFIGYTVSVQGAFVGLFYSFVSGFILGFLTAVLRNSFMALYVRIVRARAELSRLHDFLDRF